MAKPSLSRGEPRRPGRPLDADGVRGRELLLEATRQLMIEKGLPRITVREVAQRAGVGPGLVNYYFGSKAGLLNAIMERQVNQARQVLQQAASAPGPIRERLRSYIKDTIRAMAADPYLPRLIVEQVLFADEDAIKRFARDFAGPNLEAVSNLVQSGIEAGEFRPVDPMYFVPTMMGSCIFFFLFMPILRQLLDVREVTPEMVETFAETASELFLNGLVRRAEATP